MPLATAALAPDLLALALDPSLPGAVRIYALAAFARTGAVAPPSAVARLLDEQPPDRVVTLSLIDDGEGGPQVAGYERPSLAHLFAYLCRTPALQRLAIAQLRRMTDDAPRERRRRLAPRLCLADDPFGFDALNAALRFEREREEFFVVAQASDFLPLRGPPQAGGLGALHCLTCGTLPPGTNVHPDRSTGRS